MGQLLPCNDQWSDFSIEPIEKTSDRKRDKSENSFRPNKLYVSSDWKKRKRRRRRKEKKRKKEDENRTNGSKHPLTDFSVI